MHDSLFTAKSTGYNLMHPAILTILTICHGRISQPIQVRSKEANKNLIWHDVPSNHS